VRSCLCWLLRWRPWSTGTRSCSRHWQVRCGLSCAQLRAADGASVCCLKLWLTSVCPGRPGVQGPFSADGTGRCVCCLVMCFMLIIIMLPIHAIATTLSACSVMLLVTFLRLLRVFLACVLCRAWSTSPAHCTGWCVYAGAQHCMLEWCMLLRKTFSYPCICSWGST
jgi:hypothetical protein